MRAHARCASSRQAASRPFAGRIVAGGTRTSTNSPARRLEPGRVQLHSELTPEQAVLWLRGDSRPFALVGDWLGIGAVLGSGPARGAAPGCDAFEGGAGSHGE